MSKEIKITDVDKVKNLLIKLDLKYQASKDKVNTVGLTMLTDFEQEYKDFNTLNALDVINDMYERLLTLDIALDKVIAGDMTYMDYCSQKNNMTIKEYLMHLAEKETKQCLK